MGLKLEIVVIGLNHKTAPVELRERLSGFLNQKGSAHSSLKGQFGIKETLFLTTCNRVEILFTSEEPEQSIQELKTYWAGGVFQTSPEPFPGIYIYRAEAAIRHLFRVAASLDSLVIGEPQILGQMKEAYRQAVDLQSTGVILNRLLHKTFSVAKRIRTETGIASHAVSISFAAVELGKKIFQDLAGKKVLFSVVVSPRRRSNVRT
jgi:glutamyl-tRNA reductase